MSQENVEIVRSLYEAWNRSGGVPELESIDPGIEVDFVGGILSGSYRGHDGLLTALDSFWGSFDGYRIDVEECIATGDDVVVAAHYYARGKTSGVAVDLVGWHVWTLREGKAVRWLVVATKGEALEAAGLSE